MKEIPVLFGQGAYGRSIAPEAANNAAMVRRSCLCDFGIPGDSSYCYFNGALIIHGLGPGPLLMKEQPDFCCS